MLVLISFTLPNLNECPKLLFYVLDFPGVSERYWPVLMLGSLIESSSLLFSTVWLFIYSTQLHVIISKVVSAKPAAPFMKNAQNTGHIQGIVCTLFTCSIIYLIRVFFLVLLSIDIATGKNRTDRMSLLGWFLLSDWIPKLIPVQQRTTCLSLLLTYCL